MKKLEKKSLGLFAPVILTLLASQLSFAQTQKSQTTAPVVHKTTMENTNLKEWSVALGFNMSIAEKAKCKDVTYGVTFTGDYAVNPYLMVEGRYIKTNWKYEVAKVEHTALLLKPTYPINESLNLYGLLGYGKTKAGDKSTFNETGIAWGAGIDYTFEQKELEGLGVFMDYERLIEKSDAPSFDSFTTGVRFTF